MDKETKNAIIMEHYQNPLNRGIITDPKYLTIKAKSPTCIDDIDLYLDIEDNIIKDLHFEGEACAISTSATSIMIKLVLNKTLDEVENIIDNYKKMINHEEYDTDLLGEANCYDEIYLQQNRIKCATIPWQGLEKAINKYKETNR
jgi:nitrogen fixation NifU-like protein